MGAALALAMAASGNPAAAEVTRTTENSFVSRHEAMVKATPKEVWLALISPAGWWQSDHTWSGNAKNLTLTPQAGGCFCETIPEIDEPNRFTLQGSVEHMRVIQAYPEQALRMVGSLGPLQSEPVVGVLTIAISKTDQGTRIVWEYNVGGPMRYEIPVISKAVDGVMGAQLSALAKLLGVVAMPSAPAAPAGPAAAPAAPPSSRPAATANGSALAPKPAPAAAPGATAVPKKLAPAAATTPAKPAATSAPTINTPAAAPTAPKGTATPGAKPVIKPDPKNPSVDNSFGDLKDKPKP